MMNFLFSRLITMLIRRAQRTPYYHLGGYMERFWLVPYRQVIWRRPLWAAYACARDNTGPVSWRRPVAWLMQRMDIACRVHHILRSDSGRDPHNHPWPYLTVILRGGYFETLFTAEGVTISKKWHGTGSVLWRPANSWHRLDVPPGETAWTLFFTGSKKQTWGFNVGGTFIEHSAYKGNQ